MEGVTTYITGNKFAEAGTVEILELAIGREALEAEQVWEMGSAGQRRAGRTRHQNIEAYTSWGSGVVRTQGPPSPVQNEHAECTSILGQQDCKTDVQTPNH